MIQRFLRETATLQRRTASDAYAGPTYATAQKVKVRWHDETNLIRTSDETEVVSRAHVSLVEVPAPGDRVTGPDGRPRDVITVRRALDTRGQYSHCVAYLT